MHVFSSINRIHNLHAFTAKATFTPIGMQHTCSTYLDTLRLTFILFTPNRKPRFAVSGFTFAVLANMKLRLTVFFVFNFFPSKL
jgi:hypothetical protein